MATRTLTPPELRPENQLMDWLDLLKANGFDRSDLGPGGDTVAVGCSQCVAQVIKGVACHEAGCPNEPSGIGVR